MYKIKKHILYQSNQRDRTSKSNIKTLSHLLQYLLRGTLSPFCVSDNVCHFKRDNNLKLTRWTWLQADRAHICVGVVEVGACKTPTTLSNRRVECLRPWKPHVGRACSLLDRRIAEVIWNPLCQDFSNAYTREEDQHERHGAEVQIALRGLVRFQHDCGRPQADPLDMEQWRSSESVINW